MGKIEEKAKSLVLKSYNEYKDYMELITEQNKDKRSRATEIKKKYEENKNDEEVKDFALELFIVDDFHKKDLSILGTKFVYLYRFYMDLPEVEELDDEVKQMYTNLDDRKQEQVFTSQNGKFEEISKGYVDTRIKTIEEKNIIPKLVEELSKIL